MSQIINLDKEKVIPSELTIGGLTCIACRTSKGIFIKPEKINSPAISKSCSSNDFGAGWVIRS